MTREQIDQAIKYLDFAPASRASAPPSGCAGDDQAAPGAANLSPAPQFLDWQQNRINMLCGELERGYGEVSYLRTRLEESARAMRWCRAVMVVLLAMGGLIAWIKS